MKPTSGLASNQQSSSGTGNYSKIPSSTSKSTASNVMGAMGAPPKRSTGQYNGTSNNAGSDTYKRSDSRNKLNGQQSSSNANRNGVMNDSPSMRPSMQKMTSTGPTTTSALTNLEKKELEDARKLIKQLEADLTSKDKIIEKQRADLTKLRKENADLKAKANSQNRTSNSHNLENGSRDNSGEPVRRAGPDRDTIR